MVGTLAFVGVWAATSITVFVLYNNSNTNSERVKIMNVRRKLKNIKQLDDNSNSSIF